MGSKCVFTFTHAACVRVGESEKKRKVDCKYGKRKAVYQDEPKEKLSPEKMINETTRKCWVASRVDNVRRKSVPDNWYIIRQKRVQITFKETETTMVAPWILTSFAGGKWWCLLQLGIAFLVQDPPGKELYQARYFSTPGQSWPIQIRSCNISGLWMSCRKLA